LYSVFLLTRPGDAMTSLAGQIDRAGLLCRAGSDVLELEDVAHTDKLDVVLLDLAAVGIGAQSVIERVSQLSLPTLLVMDEISMGQYDPAINADDFIVTPLAPAELVARVGQIVYRRDGRGGEQLIRVGELTIDLQSYEVTMAGRRISLTYKEFQLLTLLASNPGRVYTREALLNQVWGYDYLGGTRTVDVHIRRLRSKLEDPDHLFVETIWNVGYRFRDVAGEA
jgi:two-component system alkaline phosphatase synthesis response regulator PhoP